MSYSKINIYFRIKPFIPVCEGDKSIITHDKKTVSILNTKPRLSNRKYQSEYKNVNILTELMNNQAVYNKTISYDILNQNTILLIAYGQTGSGKTHSIIGTKKEYGLITLAIQDFIKTNNVCEFRAIEVYQEEIFDLQSKSKQKLTIMEKYGRMHYSKKPTTNIIRTEQDFEKYMSIVAVNKCMGQTKINNISSRSHTIYYFKCTNSNQEMIAIDLAGNERGHLSSAKTKLEYKEYISINQSLFALKECIRSIYLSRPYIPFRRSKLTLLLRDMLSKEPKLHFVGTLNPSNVCYSDIIDTIEYGICLKRSNVNKLMVPHHSKHNTKHSPLIKELKESKSGPLVLSKPLVNNQLKKSSLYLSQSTPSIRNSKDYSINKYFDCIMHHYEIARKHHRIYHQLVKANNISRERKQKLNSQIQSLIQFHIKYLNNFNSLIDTNQPIV